MFKLEKLNVVKIVETEQQRDKLLDDGFTLVGEEKISIENLNLTELKEIAKSKDIEGYSNMKKDELVKALEGLY